MRIACIITLLFINPSNSLRVNQIKSHIVDSPTDCDFNKPLFNYKNKKCDPCPLDRPSFNFYSG